MNYFAPIHGFHHRICPLRVPKSRDYLIVAESRYFVALPSARKRAVRKLKN
jgi:hypothetical protein